MGVLLMGSQDLFASTQVSVSIAPGSSAWVKYINSAYNLRTKMPSDWTRIQERDENIVIVLEKSLPGDPAQPMIASNDNVTIWKKPASCVSKDWSKKGQIYTKAVCDTKVPNISVTGRATSVDMMKIVDKVMTSVKLK